MYLCWRRAAKVGSTSCSKRWQAADVASSIWGNPEDVGGPTAGVFADANTSEGIAVAVRRLCAQVPPRDATRAYAERFDWSATTERQLALFGALCKR